LAPTFADRGCGVVSAMDPHGRILGFLDRSRYLNGKIQEEITVISEKVKLYKMYCLLILRRNLDVNYERCKQSAANSTD
jgi:hypothetical protein